MKPLKTLKDLFPCVMKRRTCQKRYKIICSGCRVRWELKAEAIKWVKEDIKLTKNSIPYGVAIQIVNRWVKRFNITEDDLKVTGDLK